MLGNLDHQDCKVSEDLQVEWGQEDPWDHKENQEKMEEMEKLVSLESKEYQDLLELQEALVTKVQWEIKEWKANLEYLVPQDPEVIQERMVLQEFQDHQVRQDQQEREV